MRVETTFLWMSDLFLLSSFWVLGSCSLIICFQIVGFNSLCMLLVEWEYLFFRPVNVDFNILQDNQEKSWTNMKCLPVISIKVKEGLFKYRARNSLLVPCMDIFTFSSPWSTVLRHIRFTPVRFHWMYEYIQLYRLHISSNLNLTLITSYSTNSVYSKDKEYHPISIRQALLNQSSPHCYLVLNYCCNV